MATCSVCGAEVVEGTEHDCGQPVEKDPDSGDSASENHSHNCC